MNPSKEPASMILQYVNEELLFGEDSVSVDEDLLESGLIDSISVFGLVQHVKDAFGVDVPPQDIVIENFGSVGQIATYVTRRLGEAK